jgi:hypothetical protein
VLRIGRVPVPIRPLVQSSWVGASWTGYIPSAGQRPGVRGRRRQQIWYGTPASAACPQGRPRVITFSSLKVHQNNRRLDTARLSWRWLKSFRQVEIANWRREALQAIIRCTTESPNCPVNSESTSPWRFDITEIPKLRYNQCSQISASRSWEASQLYLSTQLVGAA